jgi:hypothetical protein
MNMISTAEKIEMIVLIYRRNRAIHGPFGSHGTFGSISESDGVYHVHADRRVVTVRLGRYGWEVLRHGCLISINHDLLEAMRDALGNTVSDDYPFRAIVIQGSQEAPMAPSSRLPTAKKKPYVRGTRQATGPGSVDPRLG